MFDLQSGPRVNRGILEVFMLKTKHFPKKGGGLESSKCEATVDVVSG